MSSIIKPAYAGIALAVIVGLTLLVLVAVFWRSAWWSENTTPGSRGYSAPRDRTPSP